MQFFDRVVASVAAVDIACGVNRHVLELGSSPRNRNIAVLDNKAAYAGPRHEMKRATRKIGTQQSYRNLPQQSRTWLCSRSSAQWIDAEGR